MTLTAENQRKLMVWFDLLFQAQSDFEILMSFKLRH